MQMPLRGSGVFRESEDVGIFLDKIVEDVPLAIDLGGALVAKFGAQEISDKKIKPVCDFVKTELISVELPKREKTDAVNSSKEMSHLTTIGLVNVPKGAIPDIDKDITNI